MIGELEHLKIKTRLIDEMFVSVMGEYVTVEVEKSTGKLWKMNSEDELLKDGQFPYEPVRIKVSQIHHVISQTY